jgi:transcriptional regulator with XRE-family HTH domain
VTTRKFRVGELARERGLTSEALAIRSGVKFSTVRNLWQNRVSNPSFDTLRAIAAALEVTIEDLVEVGQSGQSDGIRTPDYAAQALLPA